MLCTKIVLNVKTKTTICVHKMFCRYSELTIFMNNDQSVVILWVSWCKNKSFWQWFTCMGDRKKKYWKYTQPYIPRPGQQVTRIYINIMCDTKHLIQMGKINLDEITVQYLWWYTAGYFNHKFAKMVFKYSFQTFFAQRIFLLQKEKLWSSVSENLIINGLKS